MVRRLVKDEGPSEVTIRHNKMHTYNLNKCGGDSSGRCYAGMGEPSHGRGGYVKTSDFDRVFVEREELREELQTFKSLFRRLGSMPQVTSVNGVTTFHSLHQHTEAYNRCEICQFCAAWERMERMANK